MISSSCYIANISNNINNNNTDDNYNNRAAVAARCLPSLSVFWCVAQRYVDAQLSAYIESIHVYPSIYYGIVHM